MTCKAYDIPKAVIWEVWLHVRANQGAAGMDAETIERFETKLVANLYTLWNRMSLRLRAWRTCELAGLGAIAGTEPDLAEWDYGDYEGLRFAEIVKDRPGWDIFIDGCPNGETPVQVAARADRLIARLEALDGNVALFSHGHFSRVLAMRWIGMPVIQAQHSHHRITQHS
jgi:broad specificity phosphatase PhoE